ncbi:P-loop containing nucleoside triphosphate hydrolase protein [Martensiomyces pterosporus]|nr:P-loop containing nucleoside triphosphate hydrolase protein [Martensiomyces pterosporus]
MRTLLHGISGEIYPGEVIGLLGPSGAGKTTLLNILAGRIEGGVLNGRVLFRGKKRVPGVFKRRVAYVEQEDVMFPMLTVEETIMFAARLRLTDKSYTQLQKVERVANVMQQLRLSHVKGSKIGDTLNRGVSGGERKRVSIGVGLVTDPDMIVLDEPTSGLDSNSAEMVVELVREITRSRGIASVMTVHQPNANMLSCFDRILLLTQGRLVYFGSTNQAIEYFESKGFPCPIRQNPADFFIDIMSLNNRSPEDLEASRRRIDFLSQCFDESKHPPARVSLSYGGLYEKPPAGAQAGGQTGSLAQPEFAPSWGMIADETPPRRTNWLYEVRTLAQRDAITTLRHFTFLSAVGLNSVSVLLLLGLLFYKLGNEIESIQNRIGLFFALTLNSTYGVMSHYLYVYYKSKDIMLSERGSGSYRMSTYYISKVIVYLPIAVFSSWIYFAGIYFMAGLQSGAPKFFASLALFTILIVVTLGVTLLMGSFVNTYDLASVVSALIVTTWVVFGGHLANAGELLPAIKWMQYISPAFYIYEGMVRTEFTGLTLHCKANNGLCMARGDDVIKLYKLDQFTVGQCALIGICMAVGYNILAYLSLRWKAKPRYLWI